MPRLGKFRERTMRSFPRTMTNSAVAPFSLSVFTGMDVKNAVFPFVARTRAAGLTESMLIEYSPAGRTCLPQWTSYGKVNLAVREVDWAIAVTGTQQLASTTAAK